MSRSYKKTKVFANCKGPRGSDKYDKRLANRALRKAITNLDLVEVEVVPKLRDKSNVYNFNSDGKHWWAKATKKDMRK